MSRIRNMISLVIAAAMLLGMTAVAMAAGENTITVSGVKAGEEYSIYKTLDLSVNDDLSAYTYTVNRAWKTFFEGEGAGATYVNIADSGAVTWKEGKKGEADMVAFAKAAAAFAKENNIETAVASIKPEANGEITFEGLESGYYLITSTLGTEAMIETTPDKPYATVEEKNPVDTITKQVKEDSKPEEEAWGIENDAQVGDKVEFKSVATILKNTRNVKIYDTMDEGLTYSGDVKIEGLTKDKDYTVDENTNDGYAFVITLNESYLNTLTEKETKLTLTYTATLNEKAIVITESEGNKSTAIDDQINKIKITFGDAQFVEASTTTTTHKFSVYKHAEDKTVHLAGATFSLKKDGTVVNLIRIDDNNYRVANGNEEGAVETFTTNDKGDIVIWGVDSDTDYTLKETAAPSGYNMLTDEVAVTVEAENATRIEVENKTGVKLPTTGGMGTKMFYIVGMMLMTGSAVMLITKKHMKAE